MVFKRAGYLIPRSDLDTMGERLMGKVLGEWDSIDPYIDKIREAFDASEAIEKFAKFDVLFDSVEIISLEPKLPDGDPEGAILLVRAYGDPLKDPVHEHHLQERDIDRRIKAALEECIDLKIGPWRTFGWSYE
jgi:hypothetical protein